MAEKEFKSAMELQKSGKPQEALLAVTKATQLVPGNMEYITMAEMLRQQIIGQLLEQGNHLAEAGDTSGAAEKFRTALGIDPRNTYIAQRLHDVAPPDPDPEHTHTLELLASVDQINLQPAPGKKNFRLQGDVKQIYRQIGDAFGITIQFDQSTNARFLRFDLDNVDFYTVMGLVGKMTKTFWAPMSSREAIVANDTQEMRKQYERMTLRTFYVPNVVAPTELNDLLNVVRTIFDMRLVSMQPGKNTIIVRGPQEQVAAIASLLNNLMDARPELLIDVKEYELDTDKLRSIGLTLPTDFQVFSIPSEIRRVLGSDAQSVINQLNQTGTINPAGISASDLSNLASSPLLAPFLFFGKGQGLTGITVPSISGTLRMNDSSSYNLEHMTLRATDGEAATFMVGTKFPVVNSTFSNIAVSTNGATQIGNTPQFTYEDLGITLKATPHYHSDGRVTLLLDMAIQSLGTQQVNSIPDILTRSYKGTITVSDGEPSVVMGAITEQELRNIQGLPVLSQVPVLNTFLSGTNSKERIHNEVLVVITPHVVSKPFHDQGSSVFWNVGP